jgi:acyl carrier protein
MTASSDTLQQTKELLITELKLGGNAMVDDDMPLIGGDYDLDSLDILMLVTSIERHFQIKIPNETIGREAFATVATLASFIDRRRALAP